MPRNILVNYFLKNFKTYKESIYKYENALVNTIFCIFNFFFSRNLVQADHPSSSFEFQLITNT
jgi:hypothetical protein